MATNKKTQHYLLFIFVLIIAFLFYHHQKLERESGAGEISAGQADINHANEEINGPHWFDDIKNDIGRYL